MKVAKKIQEAGKTVNFAVSSSDDFSYELSEYGLTAGDKPVVAARDTSDQKFIMSDEFRYLILKPLKSNKNLIQTKLDSDCGSP